MNYNLYIETASVSSVQSFDSAAMMGVWLRENKALNVAPGVWEIRSGYAAQSESALEGFLQTLDRDPYYMDDFYPQQEYAW